MALCLQIIPNVKYLCKYTHKGNDRAMVHGMECGGKQGIKKIILKK